MGAPGDTGPRGPKGNKGATGPRGRRGHKGRTGEVGDPGVVRLVRLYCSLALRCSPCPCPCRPCSASSRFKVMMISTESISNPLARTDGTAWTAWAAGPDGHAGVTGTARPAWYFELTCNQIEPCFSASSRPALIASPHLHHELACAQIMRSLAQWLPSHEPALSLGDLMLIPNLCRTRRAQRQEWRKRPKRLLRSSWSSGAQGRPWFPWTAWPSGWKALSFSRDTEGAHVETWAFTKTES